MPAILATIRVLFNTNAYIYRNALRLNLCLCECMLARVCMFVRVYMLRNPEDNSYSHFTNHFHEKLGHRQWINY